MQSMQLVSCLKQVSYRTAPVLAGARHLPGLLLLAAARQPRRHPPHACLVHAHAPRAAGWVSFAGVHCFEGVLLPSFMLAHSVPAACVISAFYGPVRIVEVAAWCSRQTSALTRRLPCPHHACCHGFPAAFDFWRYLTESMEDDFSQVGCNVWVQCVGMYSDLMSLGAT